MSFVELVFVEGGTLLGGLLLSTLPMSKYPGNPYWCEHHDQPIAILSLADWDEAEDQGYITPEHVLDRLAGILGHAMGNEFNEEGFLAALVADGYRLSHGVTVRLWPNDHPPPHIHVEVRGRPDLHLRLDIRTGEVLAGHETPPGMRKKLSVARDFLTGHTSQLMKLWDEFAAASPAHG